MWVQGSRVYKKSLYDVKDDVFDCGESDRIESYMTICSKFDQDGNSDQSTIIALYL